MVINQAYIKNFAVLQMIFLFFLKISTCHLRSFSTNPQSYPQLLLIFSKNLSTVIAKMWITRCKSLPTSNFLQNNIAYYCVMI